MSQSELLSTIGVVIVVLVLVLALKARSERALLRSGGRLSVGDGGSPAAPGSGQTSSDVASDDILVNVPEVARPQVKEALEALGSRVLSSAAFKRIVNVNVKTVVKVPTKEMADAIAARERAKGFDVEIIPPDQSGDTHWQVTAQKPG